MISQSFRYSSFYCRSEHNMATGYISRASEAELLAWGSENGMTRIDPSEAWGQFCAITLLQHDRVVSIGPEPTLNLKALSKEQKIGMIVEWQPSGYTLCRGAEECGFNTTWISPRHSMMARIPKSLGVDRVHFWRHRFTGRISQGHSRS